MGKVYMIGSQKGGCAKTATTFNLAYSLAKMGKKVLAVDFDSQANFTTCYGIENTGELEHTIGHLMMAKIEDTKMPTMKRYIQTKDVAGILLTMCDARTRLCRVLTENFQGQIRIFDTKIPNTVKVGFFFSPCLIK
ncbi:MAG: AAA family ATPase [Eubacteriales bacterium]|nr:AAA family ATPase [Eubacteriales bacterium]